MLSDPSTPVYLRIVDDLARQIRAGAYPVGARLPSERELARLHGVSRMTAREALEALRHQGLVLSRPGKGTYVAQPRIQRQLLHLTSFTEEMWKRGLTPSSRVLRAEIQPADPELARVLGIQPSSETAVLTRVRLANGLPIGLETAHLAHDMCPGIFVGRDFSTCSLYQVLREEYGWSLAWARQTIEARMPQPVETELLELDDRIPVLSMSRTTYTQDDRPLEFVRSVYRADRYQFSLVLRVAR